MWYKCVMELSHDPEYRHRPQPRARISEYARKIGQVLVEKLRLVGQDPSVVLAMSFYEMAQEQANAGDGTRFTIDDDAAELPSPKAVQSTFSPIPAAPQTVHFELADRPSSLLTQEALADNSFMPPGSRVLGSQDYIEGSVN